MQQQGKIVNGKFTNIETLRGFVVLLVIIGHVIGSSPEGGMKMEGNSPFRYLYLWIDYIQMPLFTAIAGWVYALKPLYQPSLVANFLKKKAIRLLVPMVAVGTLYFLTQYFVPGTNQENDFWDIWRIYVFPYTLYWYLPSLFLIFAIHLFFDVNWGKQEIFTQWFVWLCIAFLIRSSEGVVIAHTFPNFFSFKGAMNQLPYFVLGVGIQRFQANLYTLQRKRLYIWLMAIGLLLLQIKWYILQADWFDIVYIQIYNSVQPIWVMGLLLIVLNLGYSNRFLTWVGKYAYTIYLFHGFATSGVRIGLRFLGIYNTIVIFITSALSAIIVPMLIEKATQFSKIAKLLLLGQTPKPKKKTNANNTLS